MTLLTIGHWFALLVLGFCNSGLPVDDDAALAAELRTLDQRVARIDDLTATFEQRKHTVLLREPIVSSGTVRVCGETMRWDTRRPSVSHLFMNEAVMKIYYPDHNTLEVYQLDERLGQLAASPLPRLQIMQKHFHIARDEQREQVDQPHVALRLTPRSEQLAEHLIEVRVVIDAEQAYLLRVEMTDIDEERTVIVLTDHRVNTGMEKEELELKVPPATRVVRPLDDLRGGTHAPSPSEGGGP